MDLALPDWPQCVLLGLRLAAVTTRQFLDELLARASERRRPWVVGYLNAATVNLAFDDADYAGRIGRMDCLYADGMAVVWAARAARVKGTAALPERVNAGDFTRELMGGLAARGLRLALVGGRPGEAERAAGKFRAWQPALQVVYLHDGYFTEAQSETVLAQLEQADPDLVLLGMGAPRQERWALEWAPRGRARVWWCVGALFEYYAGTRGRAPEWVRRAGLEWAWRLALEPGRLAGRYLIGNPLFIWRVWRGRPPRGLPGV